METSEQKVNRVLNKENLRLISEIEQLKEKVTVLKEMNAIQRHQIYKLKN